MASVPSDFTSYMKERVSLSRWDQLRQYSLFLFLIYALSANANTVIFDHPRRALLFALFSAALAFSTFVTQYLRKRFGEWTWIVFLLVLLAALAAIIALHY